MEDSSKRSLIISIPKFLWKWVLFVSLFVFGFGYWYYAVRPYFWIREATVQAYSVVISPEFSSKILKISKQVGDLVKKGEILCILDTALVQGEKKEVEFLIQAAQEKLKSNSAEKEKAMQEYLEAVEQQPSFASEYLEALEKAQATSEKTTLEIASLQSSLEAINAQIEKRTLHAPFDGIVLSLTGGVGSFVKEGDMLLQICDPEEMWIEAYVPESKLAKLFPEEPVRVFFPSFPKQKIVGRVSWIGPRIEEKGIPIKIVFSKEELPLKPGLHAQVGLKIE